MSRRRKTFAALVAVAVTAALFPGAPAQAIPVPGWFLIVNEWDMYLTPNSDGNGTRTVHRTEIPGGGVPAQIQLWRKVSDSGYFRFRSARTEHQFALTVNSGVDWVNKPVNVYTDTAGDPDQLWRAIPIPGTARYELKNPATGKCLAVPEEAHEGGEQLYVMACNKNLKSQRWRFPVE